MKFRVLILCDDRVGKTAIGDVSDGVKKNNKTNRKKKDETKKTNNTILVSISLVSPFECSWLLIPMIG